MVASLLIRIDTLPQLVLIVGYLFIARRDVGGYSYRWPAASLLIGLAAILVFQWVYFGDLLPNTYYLKVTGVTLPIRLKTGIIAFFSVDSHALLMPLVIALGGLCLFADLRTRENWFLFGMFAVQCAYSIWAGGDYAEHDVRTANRFISQGMPALFIIFSLVMARTISDLAVSKKLGIEKSSTRSMAVVLAVSLGLLTVISAEPWLRWTANNAPMLDTDIWRARLGVYLKQTTPEDAIIAVHAAGNIPYFSDRRTIDLLGKSDPVVAKGPSVTKFNPGHNKWNYRYSITEMKPDIIADEWGCLRDFCDKQDTYLRLGNGIWINRDSNLPDVNDLARWHR
jgi:hypothetical protein